MESSHDVPPVRMVDGYEYRDQLAEVYDLGWVCLDLEQAYHAALLLEDYQRLQAERGGTHWPALDWVVHAATRYADCVLFAYLAGITNYVVAVTDLWSAICEGRAATPTCSGAEDWGTVERLREQIQDTPEFAAPDGLDDAPDTMQIAMQALATTEAALAELDLPASTPLDQLADPTRSSLRELVLALHDYGQDCNWAVYRHAHLSTPADGAARRAAHRR